jgi:DNA-binding SARP family transcriptional activator
VDLEFRLLGPLEIRSGGITLPVLPGRQRTVLAALLLRRNRVVSIAELAEMLWGSDPPRSARVTVQNYVKRLREALGEAGLGRIATQAPGYVFRVASDELDVSRFQAKLESAHAAAQAESWAAAAHDARAALEMWRGEPLADIDSVALALHEVPRLAELRLQASETWADASIHLGRHAEVIGEVRQLATANPLRERLHALLMLALFADGRQGEALAVYQRARALLVEELGAEPGPELRELQQRILADGNGQAAGVAAPALRYSLPPDTAAFTGRSAQLSLITAAVAEPTAADADPLSPGGVVAICAIAGMPGVGKTALAVRAGHLLARKFPDRQLFVDLHGHTPGRDPVKPEDALAGLLAATGTDPRFMPADLESRAALWRDKIAGQRVLLILDNAASSAQVAPLLPGTAGSLVLVTSRRHLADLPGVVAPLLLEVLSPEQAYEMFVRLAPRARSDPGGVTELAAMAGHLPLAVSLLARVCARHPAWTLAELADETRDRLLELTAEHASIAAAFDVSLQNLSPPCQRLLAFLGLHPGTSIDAYAAAALSGTQFDDAAAVLDGLHAEGLLTETSHRRYGMHDLIRRYAAELAADKLTTDEMDSALGRLLDYLQYAAIRAEGLRQRQTRSSTLAQLTATGQGRPDFADADQALAWLRTERSTLLACLDYVTARDMAARAVALTAGVAYLLRLDGPWEEAIARHRAAVQAACTGRDRLGQAHALLCLGDMYQLTGNSAAAAQNLAEARDIFREVGDDLGLANSLRILGYVQLATGDAEAADTLAEAPDIFRGLGDQLGLASALMPLGEAQRLSGHYANAAATAAEALAIFDRLGDRTGRANGMLRLAMAQYETDGLRAAAHSLSEALATYRELGSRLGQANALQRMGDLQIVMGDYTAAMQNLCEARAIFRDLGSQRGEAMTLRGIGDVRYALKDYSAARHDLTDALAIFRDQGESLGQANALMGLGDIGRVAGDYPAAEVALAEALAICVAARAPGFEAEVLNRIGALRCSLGDVASARDHHQRALERTRQLGMALEEGRALAGLGRCALDEGDEHGGVALMRQAHAIFKRAGAADEREIAAELTELAGSNR